MNETSNEPVTPDDTKTTPTPKDTPTDSVPPETELEPENNNEKAARLLGLID